MRLFAIILGTLVVIALCGRDRQPSGTASARSDPIAERNHTAAELELMTKAGVRGRMRDPEAVQFRNVRVVWDGDKAITCGEYNAKNGFGGYNGFKPFVGNGAVVLTAEDTTGIPAGTWDPIFAKCSQR